MPNENEPEPSSDVEDDFETDEGLAARDAEYARAAEVAGAAVVPVRRSRRAGAAAATAAIDAARQREREPLPRDA